MVILVLALFPYTRESTVHIKVFLYQWVAVVCLGVLLAGSWWKKECLRSPEVFFGLLTAFLVIHLAAVFAAVNKGHSLFEFTKWAALFILFVVAAYAYRTPKQVWTLLLTVCFATAVASVYGFVQFAGLDPISWAEKSPIIRQAPSTFGNPNLASHALLPAIVFAAGLAMRKRTRWSLGFALAFLVVFLAHLAIARTRGSLIALVGAAMAVAVAKMVTRKVRRPEWAIATTLAFVVLIGLAGVAAVFGLTYLRTGTPHPFDQSLVLRYHSFYGACRMIGDKPLLGRGPGGYLIDNPRYWTEHEKERFSTMHKLNAHVHNEPLEIAVDAGLGAGVLYLALLVVGAYAALQMAFNARDPDRRILGMTLASFFVAYTADGLFGFNVHVPVSGVLLFLAAGAMAGVSQDLEGEARHPASAPGEPRVAWRAAAFVLALMIPLLGTRAFVSQYHQQRGYGAMQWKAFDAAYASFAKAAKLTPHDWRPHHYLGMAQLVTHRPGEAVPHFERALECNPNHVSSLFAMARAKFNLAAESAGEAEDGLLDEATEYASRAARFYPEFPEIHDLLGRAGILRARRAATLRQPKRDKAARVAAAWREAERHLLRAVECGAAEEHKLYQLLAQARIALDDLDGAERAYVLALEAAPDEQETWGLFDRFARRYKRYGVFLDMVNWRLRDLKKASHLNTRALALASLWKAKALRSAYGDLSGAAKAYQDVVVADPLQPEAWRAFYAVAQSPETGDLFRTTLVEVCGNLAAAGKDIPPELHAAAKGAKGGDVALREATGLLRETVQARKAAGTPNLAMVVKLGWVLDLLVAEASDPALAPYQRGAVLLDLGRILVTMGQFERAERLLAQAQPHLSGQDYVICLQQRVNALLQMERIKEALPLLQEAAVRAPNDLGVRRALAQALVQDGQVAAARFQYQLMLGSPLLTPEGRRLVERELQALAE